MTHKLLSWASDRIRGTKNDFARYVESTHWEIVVVIALHPDIDILYGIYISRVNAGRQLYFTAQGSTKW